MIRPEIRLIVMDFDGTCAAYEPQMTVAPIIQDLLRAALALGIDWCLNSDRSYQQQRKIADHLPDNLRPKALLCRQRECHWRENGGYIPATDWNARTAKLHRDLWQYFSEYFPAWREEIHSAFNVLEEYVDDEAYAFRVDPSEIEGVRDAIARQLAPWPEARVSGNHDWAFVIHESFSKRSLVEEAAKRWDLSPRSILAIGDGINDLTMLDGAFPRHVGCPADACDEVLNAVRSAGGMVANADHAHGTAEILSAYLIN